MISSVRKVYNIFLAFQDKQGAMMTYVDRKSGYGLVELMDNRKAATFN
ncbi:hypothetical protein [uncultured Ilyobacter sp.]|nr:hypothetical protein [uncultured Ilyobacter sp.]